VRDRVVGYTPHVRVDVVLGNADVGKVLNTSHQSQCGVTGRGMYWITPVNKFDKL